MMKQENGFNMELFFAALADRTRLRLLNMLAANEVCVCFFAEVIGTNQPKISRHLAYLKRARLVEARRDGKWMHYRVTAPKNKRAAEIFEGILRMLEEDKQMQTDRRKLLKLSCLPTQQLINIKNPVRLSGASL